MRQVRSGCQQKVACINNMKQNFWEIDGNPVNLQDSHMHNCKIYSDTEDVSVCRNCCFKVSSLSFSFKQPLFKDNCTKGWQPTDYSEWVFEEQKKVKQEAMLFDQFANPPGKKTHSSNISSVLFRSLDESSGGTIRQAHRILQQYRRSPQIANLQ